MTVSWRRYQRANGCRVRDASSVSVETIAATSVPRGGQKNHDLGRGRQAGWPLKRPEGVQENRDGGEKRKKKKGKKEERQKHQEAREAGEQSKRRRRLRDARLKGDRETKSLRKG